MEGEYGCLNVNLLAQTSKEVYTPWNNPFAGDVRVGGHCEWFGGTLYHHGESFNVNRNQ